MTAARNLPAANGVAWLTQGAQLILRNPAAFLLMGLIVTVIGALPILGSMVLAVISPALYAGIIWAARVQAQDGTAELAHLFQGFKEEGRLGPLLILCLPGVVAGFIAVVLIAIWIGVALAGVGASAVLERPEALLGAAGTGAVLLGLVVVALMLVVFAVTFLAVPDVMFGERDAFVAMRRSLHGCRDNFGAMLVYLLVMVCAAILLMAILSMISSLLGQFVTSILITPIGGASMYLAWQDVLGEAVTKEAPVLLGNEPTDPPQDGGGMVA